MPVDLWIGESRLDQDVLAKNIRDQDTFYLAIGIDLLRIRKYKPVVGIGDSIFRN